MKEGKALLTMVISSLIFSTPPLLAKEYWVKIDSNVLTEEVKQNISALVEKELITQIVDEHLKSQQLNEDLLYKIVKEKISDPAFMSKIGINLPVIIHTNFSTKNTVNTSERTVPSPQASNTIVNTSERTVPSPQASSNEMPEITFVIVPQNVACKPKGYFYKCDPLTRADIDDWKNEQYLSSRSQPINQIASLDQGFYTAFQQVSDSYSIVMLFDWKQPQDNSIKLTREKIDGESIPKTWLGYVPNHKGWINHQGISYFSPHEYRWTLQLGENNKWSFEIPYKGENIN